MSLTIYAGENIFHFSCLEYAPAAAISRNGIKKYSELIAHLLVAEQHNDLLMKNNESRPIGSMSFPEVNTTNFHQSKRGKGRGRGRGRGRNFNHGDRIALNNNLHHNRCKKKDEKHEVVQRKNSDNKCYQCGRKGHCSCTCRTPRHLVELYQASLKEVKNNGEANFISEHYNKYGI
ncbi:uncharacterized protein [Solanum tuberosum]|uniref:uncharacterized protein n=1 Tax=Solanum tuberosum TaxID=4113 RepID=UPI00073A4BA3|nr:PREDICTED: uncharacterized protein LOC107061979 [Solanum tuberosum]